MDAGLKQTLVAGLITISLSIGGGWVLSTKQQVENTVKLTAVLRKSERIEKDFNNFSSKVLILESHASEQDRRLEKHEKWLEGLVLKMQALERGEERSTAAVEQLTIAVENLSKNTNKLTEVAVRLDERVKRLEREERR